MTRIGIIIGSTRPGRNGEQVAQWVRETAAARGDAEFELIDLLDHRLPHLDEPYPAMSGQYEHEHTKAWRDRITQFDGFVIVTPEYNGSTTGVLKTALDFLYAEWNNKAVGLVSYGFSGGNRAADYLRLVCGTLQMAVAGPQVMLPLATEFEGNTVFKPSARSAAMLDALLNQVVGWSTALVAVRAVPAAA
ncbi:NAD(P)H-dependent oxidoreductase [Phytomonospora sp. NPDC050363]|uniref:NADPH-dependent FMN reductase n=1 Tax=Phytomonospora sp. NPDC050363 TaxID=3155642 RepID=UPI0033EA4F20